MFFTTKGRYGLISMFELAKLDGFGPVPLSEISKRVSVSLGYLEQIFLVLRKSGLIKSVRGAKGGYVLAKRPSEISVGDILKNLEGPLVAAECVMKGETEAGTCDTYDSCATRVVLTKVTQAVDKVIESTSLQDMLVDAYFVAGIKGLHPTEPEDKK
ncbi:MAG: Rrf2 family transcriptional regulator [Bacillota bacterium]|nr:Rrf2 family transcriptional regulator [Bacillota bacterium]